MKLLFCNVGWMKHYDGSSLERPERGGRYNLDKIGHEACNFTPNGGRVYGYVRAPQIKIERIGASASDLFIDGVDVVWTAGAEAGGTYVVGWYRNARVYRYEQQLEHPNAKQREAGIPIYRVSAAQDDAVLLPESERLNHVIPRGKGGLGQANIWYADREENRALRDNVVRLIRGSQIVVADVDEEAYGSEGALRFRKHLSRERDSKIVLQKKRQVLKATRKLSCEACGFDFNTIYGNLVGHFCEVHHTLPLHQAEGQIQTRLSDLAILCSNCHRVIHKTSPMMSVPALREYLERIERRFG